MTACCILLTLYIKDELSFDRFHEKVDQIFRVAVEFKREGEIDLYAKTQAPLAKALLNEFPEVIQAVRVLVYSQVSKQMDLAQSPFSALFIQQVQGVVMHLQVKLKLELISK